MKSLLHPDYKSRFMNHRIKQLIKDAMQLLQVEVLPTVETCLQTSSSFGGCYEELRAREVHE